MTRRINRRKFLAAAGAAIAAPTFLRARDVNSKLNIAIIGSGGRGGANLSKLISPTSKGGAGIAAENIVALCDVNRDAVEKAAESCRNAKKFTDFRKIFDNPKAFDAVVVSTCEHTHAFATMMALKNGKHVYCEKPLTYNIYEARKIREEAAKSKVTTMMGIQNHANDNYRKVVEIIQSGVIGPVREAHTWVSRAWGLQSHEAWKKNEENAHKGEKALIYVTDRPTKADPIPSNLNWDLWIGPAPMRPFSTVYVPGPRWYRWWDFGNGTMSDLGSHSNDLPFWALKLKAPLTIEAKGPPPHPEIAPATMSATYEYGARGDMPALKLTWYQGEMKPAIWKENADIGKLKDGTLFIGEKGMLVANYTQCILLPKEKFADFKAPAPKLPRLHGNQYLEWITACKEGKQCLAGFEYSGWLTEANHLGNVAYRVGKKLEWDAEGMRAKNAPEAEKFIRREYRKGWEL